MGAPVRGLRQGSRNSPSIDVHSASR